MTRFGPVALFAVLCLLWGSNWLWLKLAVADAPPLAFAAARSLAAGAVLLALAGPRNVAALLRERPGLVLGTALLTNTLTYAGMYWGTARIASGLAAVVNNALMPLGLTAFGLAFREEAFSRRRIAGIVLGAAGLALLFARRSGGGLDAAGVAAVAAGTLAYCLGSVRSRPLLRLATPVAVGCAQMLAGGLALAAVAAVVEAPSADVVAALARPVPLVALAWLAVGGGVLGQTIYLRLLRDWGPTRAGMYAFVAPLVATLLGAVVLGERLGVLEVLGGLVMLGAAALVLTPVRGASSTAGSAPTN
ncbi:MAG TPA: EamA family transporter [Casimicrobiaceae bacterium]|nr:EamA family transporter [Casimicrobiaceae bacterium]